MDASSLYNIYVTTVFWCGEIIQTLVGYHVRAMIRIFLCDPQPLFLSRNYRNPKIATMTANSNVQFQSSLPNSLPTSPIKLKALNFYLRRNIMVIMLLESYKLLLYLDNSIPSPPKVITIKQGANEIESSNPKYEQWYVYTQPVLLNLHFGFC